MKPSQLAADKELQELIKGTIKVNDGVNATPITVYRDGDRPTNNPPEDFVEITYNGYVRSITEKVDILSGNLMVSLYCKMFADGTVKLNRVQKLLEQFEDKIDRVSSEHYFYKLDLDNLITPTTGDLASGYSITVFNIQWRTI